MKAIPWDEAKRRAEETRHAAGHPVRSDAERAVGQRRLDDEIRAWRLAEGADGLAACPNLASSRTEIVGPARYVAVRVGGSPVRGRGDVADGSAAV